MNTFLLIAFGFVSGIIGGMGMGGGTVLVPLLSFLSLSQRTIQAINLISFLPMCVVALGFHAKNKLIEPHGVLWIAVPAVLFAILGALVAGQATNRVLRYVFGAFLIVVGIWQLVVAAKFSVRQSNSLAVVDCQSGILTSKRDAESAKDHKAAR